VKNWQALLAAFVSGMLAGGIGGYNCGKQVVSSPVSRLTNPLTAAGLLKTAFAIPKAPARTVLVKVPHWYERTVKVPEVRWEIQPVTDTIYIPDWKLTRVERCGGRLTGIAVKGDSALVFESGHGWRHRFSVHSQDDGARVSVSWNPVDLGLFLTASADVPFAAFAGEGREMEVTPSISTGLAVRYKSVEVRIGPGYSLRDGFAARAGLDWRWWF